MTANALPEQQTRTTAVVRPLKRYQADRMALSTTEGYIIVHFADILYCEAMSNYCRIHLRTQPSLVASRTLKYIQSVLPSTEFIRPHQSYLVRFDEITFAGHEIKMSNGVNIPVSRQHRNTLTTFLRNRMPVV
jgi:two-component system LytT family response regulator